MRLHLDLVLFSFDEQKMRLLQPQGSDCNCFELLLDLLLA